MAFTTIDPSLTPSVQPNIIDNGGMEIWQRGTSFVNPANAVYTADRWRTFGGASATWTISQETSITASGGSQSKAMKVLISATTDPILGMLYYIENWTDYVGKTITISARVRSTVAGKISIIINDGQQVNGAYNTLTNTYETITATKTIVDIGQNRIYIAIGMVDSVVTPVACTYYIDNVMAVVGNQPATFMPTNPQVDLARCMRYYEAYSFSQIILPIAAITGSRIEIDTVMNLLVPKRTSPTVTLTLTQTTQLQSSPNAPATLSDSPSLWPVSVSNVTTQNFSLSADRSPATGTYPFIVISGSYTASADL